MKQFDVVTATVRIRRNGLQLKPDIEALNGTTGQFQAMWQAESDDARYPGEWAMQAVGHDALMDAGISWIASGDLETDAGEK